MTQNYDPYILWDYGTAKNWPARSNDSKWIGLIGRMNVGQIASLADFWGGLIHIPQAYIKPQEEGGEIYFTATLDADFLRGELRNPSNGKLQDLLASCESSFATEPNVNPPPALTQSEGTLVCGVIDFGCAYLHPEFRTHEAHSRVSRIHSIWDQGASKETNGGNWRDSPMGYGSELVREKINNEISKEDVKIPNSYSPIESEYLVNPETKTVYTRTHGTHLLGLAAGLRSPFNISDSTEQQNKDVGKKAPSIIFVQLPFDKYKSTQRGSLGRYIMDGIRYILDSSAPKAKIVINISYGSTTGPHDGSSMLERAAAELIAGDNREPHIVFSAGNSHLEDCHLTKVIQAHQIETDFKVRLPAQTNSETLVEFWYDGIDGELIVMVSVNGETPRQVDEHVSRVPSIDGAWIYQARDIPNSRTERGDDAREKPRLVLLAIPPLASSDLDRTVVVRFIKREKNKKAQIVQGWIEFDASVNNQDGNARFLGVPSVIERRAMGESGGTPCRPKMVKDHWNTLSGFATRRHDRIHVVGARRWKGSLPLPYSSRCLKEGDQQVKLAAAEESVTLPGILGPSVDPTILWRMNGTSVAAAMYTRRLLELLGEEIGLGEDQNGDDWVD